ncbi:LamG-like jellyroll fold domain-containing protein [Luteimicrobium xylanilyticum]|uniref:LamG-like jellyroll fold domain-containing protein n=1 Tax=Luteimicrobium xylanilyticum TaxID=1133546 RepID=UPI0004B937E3|nr:LamG-like jellyroll fold domain-containing protein [Luteimicrobium xylanilyticum]
MIGLLPLSVGSAAADESSSIPCTGQAEQAADAVAQAASCSSPVELMSADTAYQTVHVNPDGTTTYDMGSEPVRTKVSGAWKPIDRSLVGGTGGIEVASPIAPMTFSDGTAGQPLAKIATGGHELSMDVPFDLPAPEISGSQLTYDDVLPGVDLIVTVDDDTAGFGEVLRVDSPQAAANPALAELEFPLATSGDLDVVSAGGGFEARDSAGEAVFTAPQPQMWDSSADGVIAQADAQTVLAAPFSLSDDEESASPRVEAPSAADVLGDDVAANRTVAPVEGDHVVQMQTTVTDQDVTVAPDGAMLTASGTTWPVFIDPKVKSKTPAEWVMIDSAAPDYTYYKFDPDQGMGLCDYAVTTACNKTRKQRVIWEFDDLDWLGDLAGADVTKATFKAFGTHSWDCTPRGVTAYVSKNISTGTTWNSNASLWGTGDYVAQQQITVAHKSACPDSPTRFVSWDITKAAKWAADTNKKSFAIGLKAHTEASMQEGWKRYRKDASISITIERAPYAPTDLKFTDPAGACTTTDSARPVLRTTTGALTLSAQLNDPDDNDSATQDQLKGHYEIFTVDGATKVWSYDMTSAHPARTPIPVSVTAGKLKDGVAYYFDAYATDSAGKSGPHSAKCEFYIETSPPSVAPGVTVVSGPYHNSTTPSGAVGTPGTFTFTNGGANDIVSYKYNFDDDAMTKAASPGANVTFTPTKPGKHTLYVESIDRAGWASDKHTEFVFYVRVTGVESEWRMTEGTGSTVVDAQHPGDVTRRLNLTAATWVDGPIGDLDGDGFADSSAVHFNGTAAQYGQTSSEPLATDQSFSVSVMVQIDAATRNATAVSVDGAHASAFQLAHRSGAECAGAPVNGCWSFFMNSADVARPTTTFVTAPDEVVTGQWTQLTGVYDATAKTATLYVCTPGTPDNPVAHTASFTTPWMAFGNFQVGRGRYNDAATDAWPGAIGAIHVYKGIESTTQIHDTCLGAGA